ncbi:MAG: GDP-mannose 4,6-dehydratase [Gammaproteobacteria bacterium]
MKFLITGLRGFTGRYVKTELENWGHEVCGLACNLLDVERLEAEIQTTSIDAVIHLAGIALVSHMNVQELYQTNIIGTRNLLAALDRHAPEVRAVVLASSANVYGNQAGCLCEEVLPAPCNDYAVSKLAMEYMAKTWLDRLPIRLVRPFNYTGVGQSERFIVPKIVSHFKDKMPVIELGNINVSRDFSDVRDVALAYRLIAEKGRSGEVYNVCSGKAVSVREILSLCEAISGWKVKVNVNPLFVRNNEVSHLLGDGAKLLKETGFTPHRTIRKLLTEMLA